MCDLAARLRQGPGPERQRLNQPKGLGREFSQVRENCSIECGLSFAFALLFLQSGSVDEGLVFVVFFLTVVCDRRGFEFVLWVV